MVSAPYGYILTEVYANVHNSISRFLGKLYIDILTEVDYNLYTGFSPEKKGERRMKKLLQVLLPVLVLGILLSGCGRKATPAEDFSYEMDSGEVTITGYHGTEREIVIPEEIEGRPVTRIGEEAFRDYDLTSVDLPDSLLVIEGYAFGGCDCLESISFGKNLEQIGSFAFYECKELQKVSLPKGLQYLGGYSFAYCENLKELELPDGFDGFERKERYRMTDNFFWTETIVTSPVDGGEQYTVLVVKEGSTAQQLLDEAIEFLEDSDGFRYITK